MPTEDDRKQETETTHLFQMQGADYTNSTNSKYSALKPEPFLLPVPAMDLCGTASPAETAAI